MSEEIKKEKPNLDHRLFWEERYEDIDWQKAARGVIERVLERAGESEYEELVRFYGRDRIIHALTKEYIYLPDFVMDDVAKYFGLKKEDFTVYKRKQHKVKVWI
jgi:anaerobic selenocysteine-containing dehydrogenase